MNYLPFDDEFDVKFQSEEQEKEYYIALDAIATHPNLMDAYDIKYAEPVKKVMISYSRVGNVTTLAKAEDARNYEYAEMLGNGMTIVSSLPISNVRDVGKVVSIVPEVPAVMPSEVFDELAVEAKGLSRVLLVGGKGHKTLCGRVKQIVTKCVQCSKCLLDDVPVDLNFDACVVVDAGREKDSSYYLSLFERCKQQSVPVISVVNRSDFLYDIEMFMNVVFPYVRSRDIKDGNYRIVTNRNPSLFSFVRDVKKVEQQVNGICNYVTSRDEGVMFHHSSMSELMDSINVTCNRGFSKSRKILVSLNVDGDNMFSLINLCLEPFIEDYSFFNETVEQAVERLVRIYLIRNYGFKLIGRIDSSIFGEEIYYFVVGCAANDILPSKLAVSVQDGAMSTVKVHFMVMMLNYLKFSSKQEFEFENERFISRLKTNYINSNISGSVEFKHFQFFFCDSLLKKKRIICDRDIPRVVIGHKVFVGETLPVFGKVVGSRYMILVSNENVIAIAKMFTKTQAVVQILYDSLSDVRSWNAVGSSKITSNVIGDYVRVRRGFSSVYSGFSPGVQYL